MSGIRGRGGLCRELPCWFCPSGEPGIVGGALEYGRAVQNCEGCGWTRRKEGREAVEEAGRDELVAPA